jgi:hypothetical protein
MKREKAISLVLLLAEVAFTLFISGIVVPSLLRSDLATKEALASGSLRTFNIAGFAFSYTTQNVALAILGGLVGTMAAFAIHFHTTTPRNTTSTRTTNLQAAHHASPLTGLAETINRDSVSVGHSATRSRHQRWADPCPADPPGQSMRWPRGGVYVGR